MAVAPAIAGVVARIEAGNVGAAVAGLRANLPVHRATSTIGHTGVPRRRRGRRRCTRPRHGSRRNMTDAPRATIGVDGAASAGGHADGPTAVRRDATAQLPRAIGYAGRSVATVAGEGARVAPGTARRGSAAWHAEWIELAGVGIAHGTAAVVRSRRHDAGVTRISLVVTDVAFGGATHRIAAHADEIARILAYALHVLSRSR